MHGRPIRSGGESHDAVAPAPRISAEGTGKAYATPRLTALGDLRGLTFGGSPGVNDSGNLFAQEPPGGL
jgi:hypothetical protein